MIFACAALSNKPQLLVGWPDTDIIHNSVGSSELQLAVKVEDAGRSEDFIVGLRFSESNIQLAAISPAGLPVFSAEFTNATGITVNRQLQIPTILTIEDFFSYLLVCYIPDAILQKHLQPRWHVGRFETLDEQFATSVDQKSGGQEIQVRSSGTAPWYDQIELTQGPLHLRIRTLSVTHDTPGRDLPHG